MADSDEDLKAAAPHAFTNVHYCAEGVKNDFQRVVDRFLSNESVRYADFLQIWQEMHFYHVFRGRQTKPQLKEFAEECLALACELWIESADFQVQVCGLYLLYGLYFCQPLEPKSRIRMTLPMWQAVDEFVTSVKEFQHCDVEYIYMKLVLAKAFHFVATVSKENSVEDTDYRRKKMLSSEELAEKPTPTMIEDLLEPDNVLKLEVIDQQYRQMKRNLTGERGTPDLSLSVIQTDLLEAVTKDVKTFRSRRLGAVNVPGAASEASVQAQLKQKACTTKATAPPRSRRRGMMHRSGNDEIDQAAMGAAVVSALKKPGYSGQDHSSLINMPSVWNLDDELIVDEELGEGEANKNGRKKAKETKSETIQKKRKRSVSAKDKEDESRHGKRSKSASEETDASAEVAKSVPQKTPKSSSKSKSKDEPSKNATKKKAPRKPKSSEKGVKTSPTIKIVESAKKGSAKKGKS